MVTRNPIILESGQTFDHSQALNLTSAGNGTPQNSCTVVEQEAILRMSVITIPSQNVAITDHTTSGAQGSLELYDLPAKNCLILGAQAALTLARVGTAIGATANPLVSVGTAQAAADTTLTGTEANIIPSTSAGAFVSGAGTFAGAGGTQALLAASQKVYLNFAFADADSSGNDSLTVAGTVTIFWIAMP